MNYVILFYQFFILYFYTISINKFCCVFYLNPLVNCINQ